MSEMYVQNQFKSISHLSTTLTLGLKLMAIIRFMRLGVENYEIYRVDRHFPYIGNNKT